MTDGTRILPCLRRSAMRLPGVCAAYGNQIDRELARREVPDA